MKTRAAVLVETGRPLEVVEIEIPPLRAGQVLVDIAFSGVCRTQLLEARGHRGADPYLPHCLGHEASGCVRVVGAGVTKVRPGDEVILSWMKGSGADVPGSVYGWAGRSVNAGAVTTFSDLSVVSENRLTPLPAGLGLREASVLGCSAATGLGSIYNTLGAGRGASIAIFGVGGIGLCAVAGAAASGCAPVIAVDVRAEVLALARELGATHIVDASSGDALAEIKRLCPGGVDFAVEASGRATVMATALASVRPRGGTAVIVGNAQLGEMLQVDPKDLNLGKRLLGTWGGDNTPDVDFPRWAELITSGRFPIGRMLSAPYTLEGVNQALDDLEAGRVARPLLALGKSGSTVSSGPVV